MAPTTISTTNSRDTTGSRRRGSRARSCRSSARCPLGRSCPPRPPASCRSAPRPRDVRARRTSPLDRWAPGRRRSGRRGSSPCREPSARRRRARPAVRNVPGARATESARSMHAGVASDVDAAVEQDDDERHHGDALDRADREVLADPGHRSDTTAAATRNSAGAGTGTRLVSLVETTATEKPPATMRTSVAKSAIWTWRHARRPGFPARRAQSYPVEQASSATPEVCRRGRSSSPATSASVRITVLGNRGASRRRATGSGASRMPRSRSRLSRSTT